MPKMKPFSLRSTWSPVVTLTITLVPAARDLQPASWQTFRKIIDDALARRSRGLQIQVKCFLWFLNLAPILRYGKTMTRLHESQRTRFLAKIERSRLAILRKGFWGIRTLIFMGYYGRSETQRELGYRAEPLGWSAR